MDDRIGESQPKQGSTESRSKRPKGNGNEQNLLHNSGLQETLVKSPSDITVYMPGLKKASNKDEFVSAMDKISNFVESIRLSNERKQSHH